uniref:Orange domain-containing protein n=1 Tax=Rhodnius prolixus TaxID=13249 RepID=T1HYP3_RHOPR
MITVVGGEEKAHVFKQKRILNVKKRKEELALSEFTYDPLTHSSDGMDSTPYDPSKIAMDYHSIGFRECAAEVARYLVTVEGLDLQDPLRLRLMSHLQCFAAQRELSKQPPPPWPPHYPPTPTHDTSGSSTASANSSFESTSSHCDINGATAGNAMASGGETKTLTTLTPASGYHGYPHQGSLQPSSYHQEYTTSGQKPYRPWGGAELAY